MTELKGFAPVDDKVQQRIVMAVDGLPGQGKTDFALSAPDPIAFMDFDRGIEGVIQKFADKKIFVSKYRFRAVDDRQENQDNALKIWEDSRDDYMAALEHPDIKTIIVDTAPEWWEISRWAMLGDVTKVKPMMYGPVNQAFRGLLTAALDSNKNVILIHHSKKEYVGDAWNGKYDLGGFSGTGAAVQAWVRAKKSDDGEFSVEVKKCRHNTLLEGKEYKGATRTIAHFMGRVFKDLNTTTVK